MKKNLYLCILFITFLGSPLLYSQNVSLDEAILAAGKTVEDNLKAQTIIAVLNFNSDASALSEYIIEELMNYLINSKKLVVVERNRLNIIRDEMNLQLSGDVSDESARSIGHQLGAQWIISGSFTDTGTVFRFRMYSANVESAERGASYAGNVNRNDIQALHFLKGGRKTDIAAVPANIPTQPNERPVQVVPTPETPVPATPEPLPPKTGTYTVGDFGPAGGIVFYDKGSFSNGWRYLEAAPVEIEFSAAWGAYRDDVNTQTAAGRGKTNTQLIVDQLKKNKEEKKAAQECTEIDFDGFKDWFIPSKDELDLLYKNLKLKNLGGLGNGRYLSSSQNGRVTVWTQNFSNGRQEDFSKNDKYTVRVIRSF